MADEYVREMAPRSLVRRALRPLAALATVTAVGFAALADVGAVRALFWLVDPTSVELYVESHDAPATRLRAFTVAVEVGLVLSVLWVGETALSAAFGGQIGSELRGMRT